MSEDIPPRGQDRDGVLRELLGAGTVSAGPGAGFHADRARDHRRREQPPRWSTDRAASNRLAELMAARGYLLDARIRAGDVACYAFIDNRELLAGGAPEARYVRGIDRADAMSAAAIVALRGAASRSIRTLRAHAAHEALRSDGAQVS
jgi:hypothetical protein